MRDYLDSAADASDNALAADHENPGATYQTIAITGPYYFSDNDTTLEYQTFSVDRNDTSVIVVTKDADVNMTHIDVVKNGYSCSLNQASFFGANAAMSVANASVAYIDHSNITTRNGAANLYAYGSGTTVTITDSDIYSSGPCAHGLYASANGTIYTSNVRQYSGGIRSSAFAGDGRLDICTSVTRWPTRLSEEVPSSTASGSLMVPT
ncbi:hypothetical protein N7462_010910 [Penicillium macrosclerotiorum]|uniref:uncharacterized protein n=1 Tax=Penicillium macrosclerotiorum TaxID=303699 RepID=UPI002548627F|nr:uncharacterized protein N7462_010910 [Penicillium macrosclerotiorum]KAJ5669840.1 hypothetical protein N7462_010910 [Penicillium macrosclerotiorum]